MDDIRKSYFHLIFGKTSCLVEHVGITRTLSQCQLPVVPTIAIYMYLFLKLILFIYFFIGSSSGSLVCVSGSTVYG